MSLFAATNTRTQMDVALRSRFPFLATDFDELMGEDEEHIPLLERIDTVLSLDRDVDGSLRGSTRPSPKPAHSVQELEQTSSFPISQEMNITDEDGISPTLLEGFTKIRSSKLSTSQPNNVSVTRYSISQQLNTRKGRTATNLRKRRQSLKSLSDTKNKDSLRKKNAYRKSEEAGSKEAQEKVRKIISNLKASTTRGWHQFIQCDKCSLWFHWRCVGISEADDIQDDDEFYCDLCEDGETLPETTGDCAHPQCKKPGKSVEREEYFIERIIGKWDRKLRGPARFAWLVKWDGYPAAEAMWVPEKEIQKPGQLIKEFNLAAKKQQSVGRKGRLLLDEAIKAGWGKRKS
ncbi:hypothetical protein M422DRAFT_64292 [Sphaerobolus stellatus SS14]|nr:hypothetical protein M422DRAFT_64292 [Sphaerobolus stellatus SS14]